VEHAKRVAGAKQKQRWRSGEVERWRGGEVERWRGGKVEKWKVDYLYYALLLMTHD
jgi:hypothetical protein